MSNKYVGPDVIKFLAMSTPERRAAIDESPGDYCFDCESPLIPCTCRPSCSGAMCSGPCGYASETPEQTAARQKDVEPRTQALLARMRGESP